ncbi:major intrinsic protein [Cellulomonas fimi ATCC 484]|uniref:Major intrinsic protein n=1 Tax=Cellulomonas fimi (strain ATCC 484 / DSM 20113 / JCM 1341 / CCUG 24087 / LMG 16345 / NBRC 15513 / NCIMB 8980 / NCTC 7547 / NRS-133) TaxID=590998 RepID=F4H877_CELFA|nr:major intrinsic protein [Cellulomonas fimi ATCC 484]VEH26847.1 Bacterial nodulin-like intrinsic protein [Cellulomonas fimi]
MPCRATLQPDLHSVFIESILTEWTPGGHDVGVTPTERPSTRSSLGRRLAAEATGTALLVAVVVGSGIAASRLSPDDVGLQLLQNSLATVLGLAVLITALGPVSGAHLNPVVSLADWWLGRRDGGGLSLREVGQYTVAQCTGAVLGAVLANAMFDVPTTIAGTDRVGGGLLVGEVVATAGLVGLILTLVRTERTTLAAPLVGAWIGAACWFTSSTSFANPAVTVGRIFSDTFAGIAPGSAAPLVAAQLLGAVVGVAGVVLLYPSPRATNVPQHDEVVTTL